MANSTRLVHFCKSGNFKSVCQLLKHGVDPNVASEGETPLQAAASVVKYRTYQITQILLLFGAIPTKTSKNSAFDVAQKAGNNAICKLFLLYSFIGLDACMIDEKDLDVALATISKYDQSKVFSYLLPILNNDNALKLQRLIAQY